MGAAGLFENERVELIQGVIVQMSAKGPTHEAVIQRLHEMLVLALHGRASVRSQSPFAASDLSEPEPDVAVVPRGDYFDDHPNQAHLLVEVSDSSLRYDRGSKAKLYAECGVPEYWIVNLVDRLVEVHSDIVRGEYRKVVPHGASETIAPQAFPDLAIALSKLLR